MSNNNSDSFSNAFRQFLRDENLEAQYREKLLIESWEGIMGKPIASRTSKLFIKDKVLFVRLNSAPMKQELVNNRKKVLDLIREDFDGVVEEIRFL